MTEEKVTKRKARRKIKAGNKFGRWKVLENVGIIKACTHFKCKCECGTIRTVAGRCLNSGGTKSCGCIRDEKRITHGMSHTPTYKTWDAMIQRCTNPKSSNYSYYGGRGIIVCSEWINSFEAFFKDMGERPKWFTIERINNELGYFKENCSWATPSEQIRNRRIGKDNKTGMLGVYWYKKYQKYQVSIAANHKNHYIGMFKNLEEAKAARITAEQKYWK